MRRTLVILCLVTLGAGACSEAGPAQTTEPITSPPVTEATAPQPASTTTTELTAGTLPGKPAPDFTLVLGEGSTFSLRGEAQPVYLLFWAEW